ncbi:MAG: putative ATPases involved in pili biogenesis, PilB-like protein s [Parcubacteria group bacterium GW2011_GWE2_37_8]|nr:MAG: putative ATPases involved in pili biogenesis, PilB-like protein s [Parcubacteria group bacterium GW2011_GWE2_37_8]
MHITHEDLKSVILGTGLITEDEFGLAKDEAFRSGQQISDVLIGRGNISEEYLVDYLSKFFKVEVVDLKKIELKKEIIEMLPESYAKSHRIIIFDFDKEKNVLKVAMIDPLDLEVLEFQRAKFRDMQVIPHLMTQSSLKHALKQYKKKIGEEFNKIIEENLKQSIVSGVSTTTDLSRMAEAIPIITILDSILEHASSLGSSDIHFEPFEDKFLIRFRIDGIMHEILSLPKQIAPILVARVKVLANLQIDIHTSPQDGRFRFEMEDQKIDVRVNIMPTFHGEKTEMRLLRGSARPLSLNELGISEEHIKTIEENLKKTHGLVLVTGPTGHGKTTTLYAMLHILNQPNVNIVTIEDPVEYEVPRINQTQVNPKAGITFALGLRALVRQNPDIIMIGEIRDNETVDIAINSALTGHLVLSTLHTNDAPTAIPRLIDMGAPPFLLASTINVVVAQRLVRRICNVCVVSYKPAEEVRKNIQTQMDFVGVGSYKVPEFLYKGKGCKLCNWTGYRGQIGIFEIFNVNDVIRDLIMKQVSSDDIKKAAVKGGMTTMFEDGLSKVEAGTTTIEEVLRVIRE